MPTTTTDPTADVLREMLTENTGTHMLDSGFAYGRHWQHNQGHDMLALPDAELRADTYEYQGELRPDISITLNVGPWLSERVTFDPDIDALFDIYAELPENTENHWLALMEEFPQWLYEQRALAFRELEAADLEPPNAAQDSPDPPGGIYGDSSGPMTVNTYNGEDALSQTLQYTYWTDDLGEHCLLQIHGGADVRGGYTKPRAFECEDLSILDNAQCALYCTNDGSPPVNPEQTTIDGSPPYMQCHAIWTSQNAGYHFSGEWNGPGWETNQVGDIGGDRAEYPIEAREHGPGERGKLVVAEGKLYCPCCGRSTLAPAPY